MSDVPNRRNVPKRRNLPNLPNDNNGPDVPNGPIQLTKVNAKAKSTITKAHPTSPSRRTTIPHHIIEILGWDLGDVLSWEIEKRGEKYFVIIRRLE